MSFKPLTDCALRVILFVREHRVPDDVMKRLSILPLFLVTLAPFSLRAQTDAPAVQNPVRTAPAQPRVPYGAQDVLKLTRAKVSEDIVVTYVENSGTVYGLRADDIVFLRDQGVSDRVIAAMINQSKHLAETAPIQPMQPAPGYQPQPPQDYSYPQPGYVDNTQPASSVYVIPYSTPAYPYYSSYPYYDSSYYNYPYYGFYGSFSPFCFSRGFRGGFGRGFGSPFVAVRAGFGGGRGGFSGSFSSGGGHFGGGGHFSGGGGHISVGGGGHVGGGHSGGGGGGHMGGHR
jgi:hypothetical protein